MPGRSSDNEGDDDKFFMTFSKPDPAWKDFKPDPNTISRPNDFGDERFGKSLLGNHPHVKRKIDAINRDYAREIARKYGSGSGYRVGQGHAALAPVPPRITDTIDAPKTQIPSGTEESSDTKDGHGIKSSEVINPRQFHDPLAKGWPKPQTRASGPPREQLPIYISYAGREVDYTEDKRSDRSCYSRSRDISVQTSVPSLVTDDGTATPKPSRWGDLDVIDDETLALRLAVAEDSAPYGVHDVNWFLKQQEEMLQQCSLSKPDIASSVRSTPAGPSASPDRSAPVISADMDERTKFKLAKSILEWEEYLKIDARSKATLPELMQMEADEFKRFYEKVKSAYDQAKEDEENQEFLQYYQYKLRADLNLPKKLECVSAANYCYDGNSSDDEPVLSEEEDGHSFSEDGNNEDNNDAEGKIVFRGRAT